MGKIRGNAAGSIRIGRLLRGIFFVALAAGLAAGFAAVLCINGMGSDWMRGFFGRKETFAPSGQVFGNPLMGYAPCAWQEEVSEDVSLLYVDITWRELEPEEGVFDWESIERENQLERWRKEGKHLVLRFLCDLPGEERHMDIPDWLYEKIQEKGSWYDMEYGCGFSPDYGDETLLRCHEKAVEAMGEYLGRDGFVSYVELGSLGHWGEWHVNYHAGIKRLPSEPIREQYVKPWLDAFPHAKLLMRRPFTHAKRYGLGLYNDMTGAEDSTEEWLGWIADGGGYSQTGEKDALAPMPDFWKTSPAGGEFTSSIPMKEMLETNLEETLRLIERSHLTFLGPKTAEKTYPKGYEAVLSRMGYRIRISSAQLKRKGNQTMLILDWENEGAAPFYQDWPVMVYVESGDGGTAEQKEIQLALPDLVPGQKIRTETVLDSVELTGFWKNGWRIRRAETVGRWLEAGDGMEAGDGAGTGIGASSHAGAVICIGILDPMTGKPAVRLDMQAQQREGRTVLFSRPSVQNGRGFRTHSSQTD
ncbi:MAG: DUF4832 domain-containing protein [Lachnospiraceae bacterium]|nr:DUF4832 domain-containing protein [Lachnospiraceae bacterium]